MLNKKPYAKKSFGQNFLVDRNYVGKIISALDPQKDEIIVEIGAGRGALTEKLIESGARVFAVELERDMIAILKERFGSLENFQLVESDALKVDLHDLTKTRNQEPKTKLVANLPYYISTAILQKLIEQRAVFSEMILMFQREVVARITARVGNSERGFLTVLTEAYLKTEKLFDVPPKAFAPAPKVWSAVVRLSPKNDVGIENEAAFRCVVSAGFRQKRKTIANNLKTEFSDIERVLSDCGINKQRRAESLTLEEWRCLADFSAKSGRKIHGETVFGAGVDAQTRCAHYHGERDIIAVKFRCCGRWFPCYQCHAERADHAAAIWGREEFDTPAILCGSCGRQLSVNEYLDCNAVCPNCQSDFNPGCANHYHLYFEMD